MQAWANARTRLHIYLAAAGNKSTIPQRHHTNYAIPATLTQNYYFLPIIITPQPVLLPHHKYVDPGANEGRQENFQGPY